MLAKMAFLSDNFDMEIDSTELEKYINSSLLAIKAGVAETGFRIIKPISFDLAVINTVEGAGGVKIFIAKAEGKLSSNEISHIKFEAQPTPSMATVFHPDSDKQNPAR
jgi:hypothetical protein